MARLLYRGCAPGLDVMELQECLNNARLAVGEGSAFATLTVDGAFGPKTHDRVLEFQRAHGLAPDGVVGSQTWGRLDAVLSTVAGLVLNRPLGGGGNPGAGNGKQGPVYGKPETGNGKQSGGGTDAGGKQTAGNGKQSGNGGAQGSYGGKQNPGWGVGSGKGSPGSGKGSAGGGGAGKGGWG